MKPAAALVVLVLAAVPRSAAAFCGLYVAGGDRPMFNDATQLVVMRVGTRTVVTVQSTYQGPPESFALVVPVPVVLHAGDVRALPRDIVERVDRIDAPRLVESWEQDPCRPPPTGAHDATATPAAVPAAAAAPGDARAGGPGAAVEARFAVGEYQVVILSAKDAAGLEAWLAREHYRVPDAAGPVLRAYVETGSKFFVARVDPRKLVFDADGRAALSPLRFHYDSDELVLPIRLGVAASSGTQDLIVHVLAPMRYEVASRGNVTIPTNLDVAEPVRDRFAAFYTALFDRTAEIHPGAVVTEYARPASTCDPCPGPALHAADLAALGGDVLGDARGRSGDAPGLVLTRLHARYGKTIAEDLALRAAEPIAGGREPAAGGRYALDHDAQPARSNGFQARYVIRHPWTGPIRCEHPSRQRWGGRPDELGPPADTPLATAVGLAFAPRGGIELAQAVRRDVPEIGVVAGKPTERPRPASRAPASKTGSAAAPAAPPAADPTRSGCACAVADGDGLAVLALVAAAGARRRRRRRRR